MVLDENGTPLGSITVPEGGSIEEALLDSDLIPLGAVAAERGKINPKTSDGFGLIEISGLLACGLILAAVAMKRKQIAKRLSA